MASLTQLFSDIADTIRNNNPYMHEKIKVFDFPHEIKQACAESYYMGYGVGEIEGIAKGKQEEYDRFWNEFRYIYSPEQNKIVDRTFYENAFAHWGGIEYIEPPYKIIPRSRNISMFSGCSSLKEIKKQYFDLSQCDYSSYGNYATFYECRNIEVIEDIGMPGVGSYSNTFRNCIKLKTIELVRSSVGCTYSQTFAYDWALENITFEGEIGNNISFQQSDKLTTASLLSILTALSKDATYATGKTLTLNTASKAKIEADTACSEQLALAVGAGWTIAYA